MFLFFQQQKKLAAAQGCVTRPMDGNQLAAAPTPVRVPPKNSKNSLHDGTQRSSGRLTGTKCGGDDQ